MVAFFIQPFGWIAERGRSISPSLLLSTSSEGGTVAAVLVLTHLTPLLCWNSLTISPC